MDLISSLFLKWTSKKHQINSALEMSSLTLKEIWLTRFRYRGLHEDGRALASMIVMLTTLLQYQKSDSLNFGQCAVVTPVC